VATQVPDLVFRGLRRPGDLGWVVLAHGKLYAAEFGWDASFEALVARIVAEDAAGHDPAWERAWVAELDGRRVGCVFCVREDPATAQLRILLVDPAARGFGLGRRLVGECVGFAREAGYSWVVLWTNGPLVAARRIYLAAGFRLVEQERHHSFGVDLIGQSYALDLHPDEASGATTR
jgi:GNAT superfamily N-acetyltransferase